MSKGAPMLSQGEACKTRAAMAAAGGNRKAAAKRLGITEDALRTRLGWLHKQIAEFPDTSYHEPGSIQRETIQAMRDANGDRRLAAQKLGIQLTTLAARLATIRALREALDEEAA